MLVSFLILGLLFLSACGSADPASTAVQTPAGDITTVADTTEAPTTEAPTIEAPSEPSETLKQLSIEAGHIYLFGEMKHGDAEIMSEELKIWDAFYALGYRHLFEELSYAAAALLNEWMAADSDEILMELYQDWEGTYSYNPATWNYYRAIKKNYPETIFHGTDIGHQYDTTGARYLKKLEAEGKADTEEYALAQENCEQGRNYYNTDTEDAKYREKCMAENFLREYERIQGETILGFYGSAHLLEGKRAGSETDSMGQRIMDHYGDVYHWDIIMLPGVVKSDRITVAGKEYEATYFGETKYNNGMRLAFWRLENAFEDFKDYPLMDETLPYYNYPMKMEEQQIYILEIAWKDGSVEREYFRTDNYTWEGYLTSMRMEMGE